MSEILSHMFVQKYLEEAITSEQYDTSFIAGVDEAGRGPLAGPVVAAAVIVNNNFRINEIKDSKQLSKNKREDLYDQITTYYTWSVGIVDHLEIDQINILEATKKACNIAVAKLPIAPTMVLVDGNMKFTDKRFISIVKGDNLVLPIAAASIIAKVTRDRFMTDLALKYPEYFWNQNVGYGTKKHIEAIRRFGYTPYHRRSFNINSYV